MFMTLVRGRWGLTTNKGGMRIGGERGGGRSEEKKTFVRGGVIICLCFKVFLFLLFLLIISYLIPGSGFHLTGFCCIFFFVFFSDILFVFKLDRIVAQFFNLPSSSME